MGIFRNSNHAIDILDDSLTFSLGADVIIVSNDEKCFRAHKIVLGASSNILRDIFLECPSEDATLIFSDASGDILKSLLYTFTLERLTFHLRRKKNFKY